MNQSLPSNIHLAGVGSQGTICGTVACNASFSPDPGGVKLNRFISFSTSDTMQRALRLRFVGLHNVNPPYTGGTANPCFACPGNTCAGCAGQIRYIGPPTQYFEHGPGSMPRYASALQCTAHYQNWSTVGLLDVRGSGILPDSEYEIERMLGENAACSKELTFFTGRWGDGVYPFAGSGTTQPDFGDISAIVDKYKNVAGAPRKARCMLAGRGASGDVNLAIDVDFTHISACVDAFKGKPFPYEIQLCP